MPSIFVLTKHQIPYIVFSQKNPKYAYSNHDNISISNIPKNIFIVFSRVFFIVVVVVGYSQNVLEILEMPIRLKRMNFWSLLVLAYGCKIHEH